MLEDCQDMISNAIFEIEFAEADMMKKERERTIEIKAHANKGNMPMVNSMAKDLVRIRGSIAKFFQIKCQLESVSSNLYTMKAVADMSGAMRTATLAMQRMNNAQPLPNLQKILDTFAKEQETFNQKQDVMTKAMDSVFENDPAEEQKLVDQVLDEIGINVAEKIGAVPSRSVGVAAAAEASKSESLLTPDLAKRLENLRK